MQHNFNAVRCALNSVFSLVHGQQRSYMYRQHRQHCLVQRTLEVSIPKRIYMIVFPSLVCSLSAVLQFCSLVVRILASRRCGHGTLVSEGQPPRVPYARTNLRINCRKGYIGCLVASLGTVILFSQSRCSSSTCEQACSAKVVRYVQRCCSSTYMEELITVVALGKLPMLCYQAGYK